MTILVTGADGYVGWPTVLRLADRVDDRIVAVDNLARRRWVAEVGGVSAVPIDPAATRFTDDEQVSLVEADLTEYATVRRLLRVFEPQTVVHLAAQPSAPYAGIDGERAGFTQTNNLTGTLNLIHGLDAEGLGETYLIETTTTGVYGAPNFAIPEGGATMEHRGQRDTVPYPAMGGSWYHQSKAFDAANLRRGSHEFGMPITDVRTAIVYGASTAETQQTAMPTRFDFDYFFGTVVNRFCAQAIAEYPITVYGAGAQRKPMVGLEDAVESLVRLVERGPPADQTTVEVLNQVTRPVAIVELAETIEDVAQGHGLETEVVHIENPREEDETHAMEIDNDGFSALLDGEAQSLTDGIADIFASVLPHRGRVVSHEDRFLPESLR